MSERLEKDNEFRTIWEEEATKRALVKMIVEMRIKEGLTQKELAERLEISQSSIARLESGKGNPTLNFLLRWVKY